MWKTENRVALHDFLIRNPGFLEELVSKMPRCEGKTSDERAATGSQAQGWRDCVNHIRTEMSSEPVGNPTDPKFIDPNK